MLSKISSSTKKNGYRISSNNYKINRFVIQYTQKYKNEFNLE